MDSAPSSASLPATAIPALIDEASRLAASGGRDDALALLRSGLARWPGQPRLHEAACRLLVERDRAEAAVHAVAALRGDPANPVLADNVWQLFTHMGEAGEVEAFERRLAVGEDPVALVGLGNALRRIGRAHRAEACYRRALELFPDLSMILSRLACLCVEQQRLEEADALFLAAAARHGGRDTVTRVGADFLTSLKAGPEPAGIAGTMTLPPGGVEALRPLLVYTSCDSRYLSLFGPTMLRSLVEESGLDATIVLHVVNPDAGAEAVLESLLRTHGAGRFVILRETVDLQPFGPQAKTYYACSRFLMLPDLLERFGRPVLMLDIDLMAIRDLKPLLARTEGADLGLMTKALEKLDVWSLLYADVLLVRPTARARRFVGLARRYIRHFLKPGTAIWFLDQAALAGVWLAGFADEAPPRAVWFPTDIHSSVIMVDADGNYWTDDHAFFYSVRATGGGQQAMARARRRAGTIGQLQDGRPRAT